MSKAGRAGRGPGPQVGLCAQGQPAFSRRDRPGHLRPKLCHAQKETEPQCSERPARGLLAREPDPPLTPRPLLCGLVSLLPWGPGHHTGLGAEPSRPLLNRLHCPAPSVSSSPAARTILRKRKTVAAFCPKALTCISEQNVRKSLSNCPLLLPPRDSVAWPAYLLPCRPRAHQPWASSNFPQGLGSSWPDPRALVAGLPCTPTYVALPPPRTPTHAVLPPPGTSTYSRTAPLLAHPRTQR